MSVLKLLAADGFLSVNKHIAREVGLDAAVLLAELASAYNYWEARGALTEDGMFFETAEHIEENTTLSRYQQAKAIKILEDAKIIRTKRAGIPAKRYFAINEDVVVSLLENKMSKNLKTGSEETSIQDSQFFDINNNKEKQSKTKKRNNIFVKPIIDEIRAYCKERHNGIDAERFFDYYESNGWMIGKTHMKDWKAAVRTWERNNKQRPAGKPSRRQELEDAYRMSDEWARSDGATAFM